MTDGNRAKVVDHVIMHHSTGPRFANSLDLEVQDWFDKIGKGRGYKNHAHSYHYHPSRSKETFSQAQYALRRYTKDDNKYGWKLTLLMKDPQDNVAWHAGNWPINQRSIGIETCGNYVNELLPDMALMLIADSFRWMDDKLKGNLKIEVHKTYMATQCPGRIAEQRVRIVDMFNKVDYWKERLWPTKPEPIEPVEPTEELEADNFKVVYETAEERSEEFYSIGGDAMDEYKSIMLLPGEKKELLVNDVLILFDSIPMTEEKTVIDPKTLGDNLKGFAPYSATAQFVGVAIGTIVAYQYDLPVEIALAVAGLAGFLVNSVMVITVFIGKKVGR